jgi:hypothetical protein
MLAKVLEQRHRRSIHACNAMVSTGRLQVKLCVNTLYDQICMDLHDWSQLKALTDFVIQRNTTCQLGTCVSKDLDTLRRIRFLIVDLNLSYAASRRLCADFPQLEILTVPFYHSAEISDEGNDMTGHLSNLSSLTEVADTGNVRTGFPFMY